MRSILDSTPNVFSSIKALLLCAFILSMIVVHAQVSRIPSPAQPATSSMQPMMEPFPDALSGMELSYKTSLFGEVELTFKKYFGSQAEINNHQEKLTIRETMTGIVSAQPMLSLQSVKIDTGIVNTRCAGYKGAYVKVATYSGKVKLMNPMMGGYDVTLGYCCWDINPNMVNIQGIREGKHPGLSLNLHLPEMASMDTNSAPVFQYIPVLSTCINQLVTFNSSAIDADGDSLAYEFYTLEDYTSVNGAVNPAAPVFNPGQFLNVTFPGGRPPFQSIAYAKGYDFEHPMNGQQMIIDSRKGMVTMKPEKVGDYLVGIAVKEYRNRKLLGTVKRVIKIKVLS